MADNSVRNYLALEEKYQRVITLAAQGDDMNIDDLRRALDDIYNTGRDAGPVIEHPRRPLAYEISDNIVLIMGGGTSERGARSHTENLVNAARGEGFKLGYADAKRKVLSALTGQEA
jgi:hypothetical protein